jgi:dienelactone hydrolase
MRDNPYAAALLGLACLAAVARADEPRTVHQYLETVISPDARAVASVEGDSSASGGAPTLRDLVIRDSRTGKAVSIALPCGRVAQCWPGSPVWSADARQLSFTLRKPGTHARSLYRVQADGGALSLLLEFNGTLQDLKMLPDGRLAMLAVADARKEVGATQAGAAIAGDLDAAPPEQRIAVLEGGALHFFSPPDLFVYEYDSRAGGGFIGTAAPGDGDNNWWSAKLYAFGAGDAQARLLYAPADARQQLASPVVSPDGTQVAFIGGLMSDFGSTGGDVYVLGVAGGAAVNVTPGMPASATAIGWNCDGHLLAKLLKGDRTEFLDLGRAPTPRGGKLLWSGMDSLGAQSVRAGACPGGVLADVRESFTAPPEIVVGKIGHWRPVTALNAGLSLPGSVQSIWWKNDGFSVQGWLLLPPAANGKVPTITQVHGGPAAAYVPRFLGPGTSQALLEHGYALFRPNPRGSYGQGERFTQANVRDFGHGDLADILAGIDAAAQVAPVDLERLGLTGGSYGGFMSMWAVTQTNRFKAAVASAGISNWLSYYGENGIDGWMIPYFGASAYDDAPAYARASAINFMHNVKTPTFAYVGERDIECPAPQTQEFWHAMKALNVPTSVMIYPGEGHGLRDPANLADAQRRTLEWFDRYLQAR